MNIRSIKVSQVDRLVVYFARLGDFEVPKVPLVMFLELGST